MITSISHVSVNVGDMAQAVRLYLALGLPVVPLSPTRACVLAPNACIVLNSIPHALTYMPEVHALGWRHLCVQVPAMPLAIAVCQTEDVTPLSDPVDLRTGHLYVYARTPDHAIIEIEEVPYTPFNYPSWLGHIACVSADVARLKHFYAEFIGGEVVDPGVIGPNPAYDRVVGFVETRLNPVWIKRLNLTIELWQFVSPPSPPRASHTGPTIGYQSIGMISDALEADMQRCCDLGGTLIQASDTHVTLLDCDQNQLDLYTHDDPLIRACGSISHPTLLSENATYWRPRPPA